ncbi:hypothetical protein DBV15_06804, partial [Temnothorax longispinosus]
MVFCLFKEGLLTVIYDWDNKVRKIGGKSDGSNYLSDNINNGEDELSEVAALLKGANRDLIVENRNANSSIAYVIYEGKRASKKKVVQETWRSFWRSFKYGTSEISHTFFDKNEELFFLHPSTGITSSNTSYRTICHKMFLIPKPREKKHRRNRISNSINSHKAKTKAEEFFLNLKESRDPKVEENNQRSRDNIVEKLLRRFSKYRRQGTLNDSIAANYSLAQAIYLVSTNSVGLNILQLFHRFGNCYLILEQDMKKSKILAYLSFHLMKKIINWAMKISNSLKNKAIKCPLAPLHSMNGVARKSSRQEPGLDRDWPPPWEPAPHLGNRVLPSILGHRIVQAALDHPFDLCHQIILVHLRDLELRHVLVIQLDPVVLDRLFHLVVQLARKPGNPGSPFSPGRPENPSLPCLPIKPGKPFSPFIVTPGTPAIPGGPKCTFSSGSTMRSRSTFGSNWTSVTLFAIITSDTYQTLISFVSFVSRADQERPFRHQVQENQVLPVARHRQLLQEVHLCQADLVLRIYPVDPNNNNKENKIIILLEKSLLFNIFFLDYEHLRNRLLFQGILVRQYHLFDLGILALHADPVHPRHPLIQVIRHAQCLVCQIRPSLHRHHLVPEDLPGKPGVPGGPRSPFSPDIPGRPGFPSIPGNPGNPGEPLSPCSPFIPVKPSAPGLPGPPGNPRLPGYPFDPSIPGSPRSPFVPGNPGRPALPGSPVNPGSPRNLVIPGRPFSPLSPGGPGRPGLPLTDIPGSPLSPFGAGAPGKPLGPSRPSSPGKPIGPMLPLSPRGPGKPLGPTGPGAPIGPIGPGNPSLPGGPGSPLSPVKPRSPLKPFISPGGPIGPGKPSTPGSPGKPRSPGGPRGPVSPGIPSKPRSPLAPRNPGKQSIQRPPISPLSPGFPGRPGKPSLPDVPASPFSPGAPGAPGIPSRESPGRPRTPTSSGSVTPVTTMTTPTTATISVIASTTAAAVNLSTSATAAISVSASTTATVSLPTSTTVGIRTSRTMTSSVTTTITGTSLT